MANLNGFDANTVEPINDFDPIPAGKYVAVITASQFKENRNKTGEYLELTFQIVEGDYKNRLLWARLCLSHPNPTTAKIARGHLAGICKAVGVLTPADSAQLHNLPLVINVTVKKRTDTGELTNEIRGFSKRQSAPAVAAPSKSTIAPWRR
ncbi:MAG TPA: DUF669 domain-containing protein [Anaerohalosphaeraceae bacterium]|nr:DUF669 domain-containing protein [Anaerohalosphaeraceae bacterium]